MNFLSAEVRRNPFPFYEQMRCSSPVLHDPKSDFWMIFDYDGVKRALNDHDAFSSSMAKAGRGNPPWFIFLDPPRHTKLRNLVLRAFTPRTVACLEPRIRELSRQLLDQTIERGEMDMAADFSVPLPMMVIAQMLGLPAGDWLQFKRWSDVILKLSYVVSGGEEAAKAVAEVAGVTAEMKAYLRQQIAQGPSELLAGLVEAEVDGERLSEDEIRGFFQLLLIAGTETTTNLINNAILCFVENPEQLARLKSAPDLLPAAIEEVLRYRSPIQWMFRASTREVELSGQVIPAGKLVLPVIGSANHDPRQFRDAGRFDIQRGPAHIAFGHGVHFCLGAPLARLEAKIALSEILSRWRNFRLASSEPWEPRRALHVHGPSRLPIVFEQADSEP